MFSKVGEHHYKYSSIISVCLKCLLMLILLKRMAMTKSRLGPCFEGKEINQCLLSRVAALTRPEVKYISAVTQLIRINYLK